MEIRERLLGSVVCVDVHGRLVVGVENGLKDKVNSLFLQGHRDILLNFKDVSTLSRFLTESGKLLPKRTTKVNARFQRQLGRAVKRARYLALIPYVREHEA